MALVGMCRRSGRLISGVEHLVQSIGDILSTRKGTDLAGKAAKGLVARCAKRRTRRRVSLRRWLAWPARPWPIEAQRHFGTSGAVCSTSRAARC